MNRFNMPSRRACGGFTLVELMVAMAGFSIISLAAFSVLSSSQRSAVMNDQTVQIQRNVRIAMDIVSRDIRMAGYGNPPKNALSGCVDHLNATDNAIGADAGSDSISVMTVDQQVGTLTNAFTTGNTITVAGLSSDVAADVTGGKIVLITLDGLYTARVSAVAGSVLTLIDPDPTHTANTPLTIVSPMSFPAATSVIRLTCVTYTVNGIGSTPPFQLMRNTTGVAASAVAIVDGIEDLQLAYAIDADADGKIDDQLGGVASTFDCLDFVPNNGACTQGTTVYAAGTGLVSSLPASMSATPTKVRLIRITLVGRQIPPLAKNVANNTWGDLNYRSSSAIVAEDHTLADLAGFTVSGNVRRRALTRIVNVRDPNI